MKRLPDSAWIATSGDDDEEFRRGLAGRLRFAREALGLSQTQIAELAGMPPSLISHYETGRRAPSVRNAMVLADVYQTSMDFLCGRTP